MMFILCIAISCSFLLLLKKKSHCVNYEAKGFKVSDIFYLILVDSVTILIQHINILKRIFGWKQTECQSSIQHVVIPIPDGQVTANTHRDVTCWGQDGWVHCCISPLTPGGSYTSWYWWCRRMSTGFRHLCWRRGPRFGRRCFSYLDLRWLVTGCSFWL